MFAQTSHDRLVPHFLVCTALEAAVPAVVKHILQVFVTFVTAKETLAIRKFPPVPSKCQCFLEHPLHPTAKPGMAVATWSRCPFEKLNPSARHTCESCSVPFQHVTTRLVSLCSLSLTQQRSGEQRRPGTVQKISFLIQKP